MTKRRVAVFIDLQNSYHCARDAFCDEFAASRIGNFSPLGLAVVLYHRPSPWGWVGIAACLAYPPTSQMIVSANPALWIGAFVALGTIWRPAFALVLMKPSLAPLALLGIRSPGWWALVLVGAVLSVTMLPWTIEWFGVILNGRGPFSGLLPVARDAGWVLIPLIAWANASMNR